MIDWAIRLPGDGTLVRPGDANGPYQVVGEPIATDTPVLRLSRPLERYEAVNWTTRRINADLASAETYFLERIDIIRATRVAVLNGAVPIELAALRKAKSDEASLYLATPATRLAAIDATRVFPWLLEESSQRKITMLELANLIVDKRNAADAPLRAIELVAQSGQAAVRAATSISAKRAAFVAIAWPGSIA